MLLQKLKEKLSKVGYSLSDKAQELLNKVKISGNNKLGKKIAGLVLAGMVTVTTLGIASCTSACNPFVLGDIQTTQTPDDNTPSNPSNPGQTNEHSKIVNNLLYDEYYRNLAYKLANSGEVISKDMLPVPYKFLREEGKDVDAYLDGTLNAFASSYMYNDDKNHLYVSVKAENKSYSEYGNYYTNYVLKYPLTDQESEEFLYLCKGEYLQGLLFIQELDIQKKDTRTVLSEVNIAKDTYEAMLDYISYVEDVNPVNPNRYNSVEVDFLNSDMEKINVTVRGPKNLNYSQTTIRNLTITDFTFWVNPQTYDNNVLWYGRPDSGTVLLDEYLSSTKNITSFGYGRRILNSNPYYAFSTQK